MDLINKFSDAFWSTQIWLPPNTTWADIAPGSRQDVVHANYKDLIWPIPFAAVVMLVRYTLERFWISPIGKSLGIRSSRPKKAANVPILETAYAKSTRLDNKWLAPLSKQTDMSERQIERWWRLRRAQDKPSTLVKFCENTWRCIYYLYSFIFGVIVLWDKPWFWDVKSCWYGYPHQSISNDIWWYYMISMSFYWSLTGTQFFDVKRKDFWQMFIHHMVTLLLMSLSWVCNLHRVGSLVLVVHDCADIFLEAAKLTKYANYQKLCDAIFAIFTVVWIVTRLGFYPRIIYSSSVEAPRILPMFPAYYIFNSLLLMLLVLHVIWTYMILKIVVDSLQKGLMSGDIRSSDSEDLTDSSENARLANGSARSKNKSNSGATSGGSAAGAGAGGATQRKSNNANNHTTEAAGGAATTAAK
ncbi:ceramide synthase 6 [Drosophila takahashii]|uniref:ceramide synthase 6 n=1 Tax=Drosophila takahashii TaxID=29030 RepID=UPI001CF8BD45|nr:ceramide synthase 6 [Drosophila takahashii]